MTIYECSVCGHLYDEKKESVKWDDLPSDWTTSYLLRLREYKAKGFPVFVCEYAVNKATDAYRKAMVEGFIAYATRRSLSRLTTTPPDFLPASDD